VRPLLMARFEPTQDRSRVVGNSYLVITSVLPVTHPETPILCLDPADGAGWTIQKAK